MKKTIVGLFLITGVVAVVCVKAQLRRDGPTGPRDEEQAIRNVPAQFYEGWNAHDVDKMVSIYAEDIDHINVFGQWHKGKADIRKDLTMVHTGPGRNIQRKPVIEKIRLLTGCCGGASIHHPGVRVEPGRTDSRDVRSREAERWLGSRQLHQR